MDKEEEDEDDVDDVDDEAVSLSIVVCKDSWHQATAESQKRGCCKENPTSIQRKNGRSPTSWWRCSTWPTTTRSTGATWTSSRRSGTSGFCKKPALNQRG